MQEQQQRVSVSAMCYFSIFFHHFFFRGLEFESNMKKPPPHMASGLSPSLALITHAGVASLTFKALRRHLWHHTSPRPALSNIL